MILPFCYKATHPTVALILRELYYPRSGAELSERLKISRTHARDAIGWMHRQRLIRIQAWVLTSGRVLTRLWVLSDGHTPDAVKPFNKRKRRQQVRHEKIVHVFSA